MSSCLPGSIKCLAQGHNTVTEPVVSLELAILDPQSNAQPTEPLHTEIWFLISTERPAEWTDGQRQNYIPLTLSGEAIIH